MADALKRSASGQDPVWEAALDWLLNEPGDPAALQAWLDAAPEHLRAYHKAQKVWGLSGQVMNKPGFDCPLPPPARVSRTRRRGFRQWLVASAVAACAVLLGLPDWQGIGADYRSPAGEHRAITLADGSVVELDSGSAIDVRFSADKRQVILLRGQAFFSVVSQPERVFQVQAQGIDVTVTGTAFAVEVAPRTIDISVARGSVNVADTRQVDAPLAPLKPGQRISFGREGQGMVRSQVPVEQIAAWRHWQLLAIDQPLSAIVERLRQYQPGLILLDDSALGQRTITAALDLRSPRQALQAAIAPLGARVKRVAPYVLQVSAVE